MNPSAHHNSARILLYRGRGPISKAIQWQTRSVYSHAAILLPDGVTVIEAMQFKGVRTRSLYDPTVKDAYDQFTVASFGPLQWAMVERFCRKELGSGYDYRNILRFITRTSSGSDSRWFCSELVFAAVQSAGLNLLERIQAWAISPGDLGLSPYLVEDKL